MVEHLMNHLIPIHQSSSMQNSYRRLLNYLQILTTLQYIFIPLLKFCFTLDKTNIMLYFLYFGLFYFVADVCSGRSLELINFGQLGRVVDQKFEQISFCFL